MFELSEHLLRDAKSKRTDFEFITLHHRTTSILGSLLHHISTLFKS